MSLLKFGAYQKHAVSPWATGPPLDAKCNVCLMDIEESDDIEWAPCGHFGHKVCFARLSTCPDCRQSLGHGALVDSDDEDMRAEEEEAEQARYMERIRQDVERARSDVSVWNMFTDLDRELCIDYANGHGRTPLPYADIERYLHNLLCHPTHGRSLYITGKALSVSDVSILARMLKYDTTFTACVLRSNGIGPEGAALIADVLRVNTTISYLDLGENAVGPGGASSIADALLTNTTLAELTLSHADIGSEGTARLCTMLLTNTAMYSINLTGNHIGEAGVESLVHVLFTNKTLMHLDVSENDVGSRGATSFARALYNNMPFESLTLDGNNIGPSGAKSIADALLVNTTLKYLYLSSNPIGNDGLTSIATALLTNTTVGEVELHESGADKTTATHFEKLLERSEDERTAGLGRWRLSVGWYPD